MENGQSFKEIRSDVIKRTNAPVTKPGRKGLDTREGENVSAEPLSVVNSSQIKNY